MKPSLRAASLRKQHELLEVGLDGAADLLAGLPDALPLGRCPCDSLSDFADFAVGELLVADPGSKDVERLFDFVGLGRDPLEQLGIDLLFEIDEVQDVDLPPQRADRQSWRP